MRGASVDYFPAQKAVSQVTIAKNTKSSITACDVMGPGVRAV